MSSPANSLRRIAPLLCLSVLSAGLSIPTAAAGSPPSLAASIEYLRQVQDRYHDRIPVYEDVSSAGNHFHTYAKIPDSGAAVSTDGSWTASVHSGATAIRCEFEDVAGVANFGGFYFLNGVLVGDATSPQPNFGEVPDAGFDLGGAVRLTFWARGEEGGEEIDFFLAGVGRDPVTGAPVAPFPGSSPRHPALGTRFVLTDQWRQYSIEGLTALDVSYVLGGFAWVADDLNNPSGAIFYLDDIEYELSPAARAERLAEPRFLASYTTLPLQPAPGDCATDPGPDLALRNMAFSYDNALALLAFLAHGSDDSLRRARLIGDAFVYASGHDRFYTANFPEEVRIRSGYAAGDVALPPGWRPGGVDRAVALPGYFCEQPQMFFETGQEALDVGNNAWAMIALLALHDATGDAVYLGVARQIGDFIESCRNGVGTYQGYQGGIDNPENDPADPVAPPTRRVWASGEHNLDVHAGFRLLAEATGEPAWLAGAEHARSLVEAIWDPGIGCYRAGTLDPENLNISPGQLPLDVQSWAVLALADPLGVHPALFACPEGFHRTSDAGFLGFDFNDDLDGVWFEGTAQMAAAYAVAHAFGAAELYRTELARAQASPPYGDGEGIAAATVDGLTSGFGFDYYRRFHTAVAAWNVFAQRPFNPYYQEPLPVFADGFESGDVSAWSSAVP